MKRFLDSVHGYILIPDKYCERIIDTDYFQRLRRIEQTSCRSIFPSARHDRFIHSLGVFHIGKMILSVLESELNHSDIAERYKVITNSYEIACLLHDIGHSPFSHTFEDYYSSDFCLDEDHDLITQLTKLIDDPVFTDECESMVKKTPHEFMGAIIAASVFSKDIVDLEGDVELVARMIIGCVYKEEKKYSLENSFISLIHGELIDADSLDYVCRDAWASGYSTVNVDVERLVSSIRICKNKGIYQVCFTPKAIDEISKALEVKTFQQFNVIYHHTVVYDQKLLVEAMKSAAMYHYGLNTDGEELKRFQTYIESHNVDINDKNRIEILRNFALCQLCNVKSMTEKILLPTHKIEIIHPMDDDFVCLMKLHADDIYINQWLSRKYRMKPLWKSPAEFYNHFDILRKKTFSKSSWIFSDSCKHFLMNKFGASEDQIWICEATPKYKSQFADKILVKVGNGSPIPYDQLLPNDRYSYNQDVQPFSYIYVDKAFESVFEKMLNELKNEVAKYVFN